MECGKQNYKKKKKKKMKKKYQIQLLD